MVPIRPSSSWEAESGVELNPKPVWFTGEL